MIEINSLKKNYPQANKELQILKGVHCQINEGDTVAILGESGSGKSTMLSLLAGLDNATSGEIKINGTNITELNQEQLTKFRASSIGIIFQQYHLVPFLTALENVSLPLEILKFDNPQQKAKDILKDVGLEARYDHFPEQLSGGEAQRVAMARAMIIGPKLLLADEPSGSLDEKTGDKVIDLMFDMIEKNKITSIIVTHSKELAKRCQRVLTLQDGILHES